MYVQCQQTATILAMGTIHAYNTSVYSPPTMINMSICGSGVSASGEGGLVVGWGEGEVLGGGGGGSKPAKGQREETRAEWGGKGEGDWKDTCDTVCMGTC